MSRPGLRPAGQSAAHSLPFELQRLIIRAADRPTLARLARVSKAYHHEATPLLWQHLYIDDQNQPTPDLSALLSSTSRLRHLRSIFCAHSVLLQGFRARKHCADLWSRILTQCPHLQCAAWVATADNYSLGLGAEMIYLVDQPDSRPDRRFEWHLYGDLHEDMVPRLCSVGIHLVKAHITVTPGVTQLSVDKLERILPLLINSAPKLTQIQLNIGYTLLEIGSRSRRMDRARAFQSLLVRLHQMLASLFSHRQDLEIKMGPSHHIFATSVDAVDRRLAAMVKADFDVELVRSRTAPKTRVRVVHRTKSASSVSVPLHQSIIHL
ncbi:hypothetical protein V8E36_004611 [Tilletia maclaganii]